MYTVHKASLQPFRDMMAIHARRSACILQMLINGEMSCNSPDLSITRT